MAVVISESRAQTQTAIKLYTVSYSDPKRKIWLTAYADTVILERSMSSGKVSQTLTGIRIGGYPESVRGLADAIYGGGGITIEAPDGTLFPVHTLEKRYTRSYRHDGPYAEAVLLVGDETKQQKIKEDNQSNGDEQLSISRSISTSYIYCAPGDEDTLFSEVDRITSVPLIPEFRDYVLKELKSRGILQKLDVFTFREQLEAWKLTLTEDEANITACINDGLGSGAIQIPGANNDNAGGFDGIDTMSHYLSKFGVTVAERIRNQFDPLFDPEKDELSPEVLEVNRTIQRKAGYSLYPAQLAAAEALKRRLSKAKYALLIAECGSGKSKIGAAAISAAMQSVVAATDSGKTFNVVLCPSHIKEKWVREIEETLPGSRAVVVNSITQLNHVYNRFQSGSDSCYIILSKEKARDGYMCRPAVIWNRRRKAFLCPHCMEVIEMEVMKDGTSYVANADHEYFRRETPENRKCNHCGEVMWTALNPDIQSKWVKVSSFGYVHREFTHRYLEHKLPGEVMDAISKIAMNPDGYFPATGAYRRFSLSTYIRKHMRGRVFSSIIDELHQYNNASGQGDAMGELFSASKKVIGMTATLINGYASGIFHLLYRISPHLMLLDGKPYSKPSLFSNEYGVTEIISTEMFGEYAANRRTVRQTHREKIKPGVSPLVYSRFLLEAAVFLSLYDMGKHLPDYEEIPVPLDMAPEVAEEYEVIEKKFVDVMKHDKPIANKVMSRFMALLTVYPDQPYGHKPIIHPFTKEPIMVPRDTADFDTLSEKDIKVLELVQRKVAAGERVLIYTSWTRIDSQQKLTKLFKESGIYADTLTVKVSPDKREKWVENKVKKGIQVLICNPSLVETGLDLNDFTTLIYYNVAYNLFTLRQSSRRSWRINQTAPKVEVYFFYFKGTLQNRAVRLMATKLAVASLIEGNFTDEGLAAMGDCDDMTSALARELTTGIKDEVEDLSETFKKMAFVKEDIYTGDELSEPAAVQYNSKPTAKVTTHVTETIFKEIQLVPTGNRKGVKQVEGQLMLFDLSA